MNDATDAVGDAPWLAPDWVEPGGAPGDFAPTRERLRDMRPAADPRLAALDGIDWQAWSARDPQAAEAAWRVLTGPSPTPDTGPAYRAPGRQQARGKTRSHPAFAGGTLYLRDQRNLLALPLNQPLP